MKAPDISESEWAVMEKLWERSPRTASELTKALRPARDWADNTVRTLLTRLVEKKALEASVNAVGTRIYTPAVTREACVGMESASFMQRIFRGASKPLLVHFARNARLTKAEVMELKRLLDRSINKKPRN